MPRLTAFVFESSGKRAGLFKNGSFEPPNALSSTSISKGTITLWQIVLASYAPGNSDFFCKHKVLILSSVAFASIAVNNTYLYVRWVLSITKSIKSLWAHVELIVR